MKIEICLTSESASKKMQDSAKLLFGAKGAKLINATESLAKVKKHLDEETVDLLNAINLFLKATLDEKTIARLKKRKGFGTLPARITKLDKAIANRIKFKIDPKTSKVLEGSHSMIERALGSATGSSAKNIPLNAKALLGAKGTKLVKDLPKLTKIKATLGPISKEYLKNIQRLLKSNLDKPEKLVKMAGIKNIPSSVAYLIKASPKYFKANTAVKDSFKGLPTFTTLLTNEASKASTGKIAKNMDTRAEKVGKANAEVKLNSSQKKQLTAALKDFQEYQPTIVLNQVGKTSVYETPSRITGAAYEDLIESVDTTTSVMAARKLDKNTYVIEMDTVANGDWNPKDMVVVATIRTGVGKASSRSDIKVSLKNKASDLSEFLNTDDATLNKVFKASGMTDPKSKQGAYQVTAKGSPAEVGARFIKQLRKVSPEFTSAILGIPANQSKMMFVMTHNGTGTNITLVPSRSPGKYNIGSAKTGKFEDVSTDGSLIFVRPSGLDQISSIKRSLEREADALVINNNRPAKAALRGFIKLEEALEQGTTIVKARRLYYDLPNHILNSIEAQLPALPKLISV